VSEDLGLVWFLLGSSSHWSGGSDPGNSVTLSGCHRQYGRKNYENLHVDDEGKMMIVVVDDKRR
jgi:hypothetical protein